MRTRRLRGLLASALDPRPYLHMFKLLNYYNYTHVAQRRLLLGRDVRITPNVSFANGERIEIGDRSRIGSRCHLWAGDRHARIVLEDHVLLGPDVFLTVGNYRAPAGQAVMDGVLEERDIVIGRGAWLGARVIVLPGVTIGEGCVVGAGSIVTRDLPAHAVAVGVPAKVVASRAPTSTVSHAADVGQES